MSDLSFEEYKTQVETQSRALLEAIQSVALGDLDVEVKVPEGAEVLSELAVGVEMMIDDLREMLAQQERARAEIEQGREQLEAALEEVLAVQRRYIQQRWDSYTALEEAKRGYARTRDAEGPSDEAWLPAMTEAVRQASTVADNDSMLAVPITLYDEVIGVVGLGREGAEAWSQDEVAFVEAIVEQMGPALESQRLFDEEQQARTLLNMRIHELDCLNDIGRKIDEAPPIPELLEWVAERIPAAMQHPTLCRAAIELEGQIHGSAEAVNLPRQMVQSLYAGGQPIGRACIAYTEDRNFLDEESSLLGDIARRVSGYIENQRLLEEAQLRAEELAALNEMSRVLGSLLSVDDVLEETYRVASRLLDTTYFSIALYDAEKDEFTLALHAEAGEIHKSVFTQTGVSGMSGYIIQNREPLLVREKVQEWQAERGIAVQGIRVGTPPLCWLGVPLVIGDRVLGAMFVQSLSTPHLYDEHDQNLMVAIASQMAIALESVRLLEETRSALAEVEATHRSYLRRGWQDHLRQREMLQRSGYLYDETQAVEREALTASPDIWRPEMDQAITRGAHSVMEDLDGDRRTGLAIPITIRGQTIGVMGVEAPGGDRQWSADDVALVEAIGDQLGQTLETARLFADTQRRAERERLISEITAKIRASTDIRDILETAATELGHALGTSRALVRVGLEELQAQTQAEAQAGPVDPE